MHALKNTPTLGPDKKETWARHLKKYFWLYLFILPGMLYLIVFRYIPMGGIIISFKNFNNVRGILKSPWVGLDHFRYLFKSQEFLRVLSNSVVLSLLRLVVGFPIPIIFALLMNEMRVQWYKRAMQTILYLPHFISWVVVYGILLNFVSPTTGIINHLITSMGGETVYFLTKPAYFRPMVLLTDIWKNVGWGTIIYMAAIAGIDPTYYEAAIIDGASRFRRTWNVTLPLIAPTIVVTLILRTGSLLSNGFEQIFLMRNALNIEVSEIFETYTYIVGLRENRFSFSTAVGLFQSVVGFVLIMITNTAARKLGEGGLW